MYAVVKTVEDGNTIFSTVPERWIDFNNSILHFPNESKKWHKLRSKLAIPNSNWIRYDCVVVKTGFLNLSDATDFEKKKPIS